MTSVEEQILENQEVILLALSKMLTPYCKGYICDENNETKTNADLVRRYRRTRLFLRKDLDE